MIASIAPSIYGYDQEKLAMILQLFSGVTKQLPDGSRIRGDLHMLLIGDPGTGSAFAAIRKSHSQTGVTSRYVKSSSQSRGPEADRRRLVGRDRSRGAVIARRRIDRTTACDESLETRSARANVSNSNLERTRTRGDAVASVVLSDPDGFRAVRADRLSTGDRVAVTNTGRKPVSQSTATDALADGGAVIEHQSTDTDRIVSIESLEPDYDWVYDLEIAGTHNYVSNGVVSHNSQMLGYIQNIARGPSTLPVRVRLRPVSV